MRIEHHNGPSIPSSYGQDKKIVRSRISVLRSNLAASLAAIVAFLLFAYLINIWFAENSGVVARESLTFSEVSEGSITSRLIVLGKTVATQSPNLYAAEEGTLVISVQTGQEIEADTKVAHIIAPELSNQLQIEKSTLDRDINALESKKIALDALLSTSRYEFEKARLLESIALREKKRAEESKALGVISEVQYLKAVDQHRLSASEHRHIKTKVTQQTRKLQQELKTAEKQVDVQRRRVQELERRVDELQILSPIHGVVGDLLLESGDLVLKNQLITAIVGRGGMQVRVEVPESYIPYIGMGMDVQVKINTQWTKGEVKSISSEVNEGKVAVNIAINDQISLRNNQSLDVEFTMVVKSSTAVLPKAVFSDLSKTGRIYAVHGDNQLVLRDVDIGLIGQNNVEVLDGLTLGDQVAFSEDLIEYRHPTLTIK